MPTPAITRSPANSPPSRHGTRRPPGAGILDRIDDDAELQRHARIAVQRLDERARPRARRCGPSRAAVPPAPSPRRRARAPTRRSPGRSRRRRCTPRAAPWRAARGSAARPRWCAGRAPCRRLDRQMPCPAADGQQQPVVRQDPSVATAGHGAPPHRRSVTVAAEQQFDPLLGVALRRHGNTRSAVRVRRSAPPWKAAGARMAARFPRRSAGSVRRNRPGAWRWPPSRRPGRRRR